MVASRNDNPNPSGRPPIPVRVCPQCKHPTRKLYRIKHRPEGQWELACAVCQARLSEDNPNYVYGGVISGTPRRRRAPAASPKA